jgi:hypothetical protein
LDKEEIQNAEKELHEIFLFLKLVFEDKINQIQVSKRNQAKTKPTNVNPKFPRRPYKPQKTMQRKPKTLGNLEKTRKQAEKGRKEIKFSDTTTRKRKISSSRTREEDERSSSSSMEESTIPRSGIVLDEEYIYDKPPDREANVIVKTTEQEEALAQEYERKKKEILEADIEHFQEYFNSCLTSEGTGKIDELLLDNIYKQICNERRPRLQVSFSLKQIIEKFKKFYKENSFVKCDLNKIVEAMESIYHRNHPLQFTSKEELLQTMKDEVFLSYLDALQFSKENKATFIQKLYEFYRTKNKNTYWELRNFLRTADVRSSGTEGEKHIYKLLNDLETVYRSLTKESYTSRDNNNYHNTTQHKNKTRKLNN